MEHTIRLRASLPDPQTTRYAEMDRLQKAWMSDEAGRLREAERDELGGRTSGTADWRAARQELGLQQINKPLYASKSGLPPSKRPLADVAARRSLLSAWTDFDLFGDASRTDFALILTTSSSQTSAIFNPTPIPQSLSFRCTLQFKLDAPPGAGEADGIAIVFSSEKKLGLGGYGMGYSGLGGPGDFAVEGENIPTVPQIG